MTYPIPTAALDDRLAILGTAGAGKTYLALGAEEILLAIDRRVIHVDPLGVAWGLRLLADGKTPSIFKTIIFGGKHGDLPINEHAGALIGETVATMRESCIIDLSELGTKASERRFMLGFLTALYRRTSGTPVHLIIDEADMFAPQKLLEKDGEAPKLLGMMETIVRRGRVKGFCPWLITQRPAVLSKDVLSQADGLIALKLTSSQDRAAIGAWIEGQADRQDGKDILASLPTMQRGQGVVWIPGRGILKTATFPEKKTFDSSRAPGHGRAVAAVDLKPIDIGALKDRLASVEQEAKSNDPKALKAEIARLRGELSKAAKNIPQNIPDPAGIVAAEARARAQGYQEGKRDVLQPVRNQTKKLSESYRMTSAAFEDIGRHLDGLGDYLIEAGNAPPPTARTPVAQSVERRAILKAASSNLAGRFNGHIEAPLQKIVDAILWWNVMGVGTPSHPQVGFIAGYSHKSGTWSTYLSRLRSLDLIEGRGDLSLTTAGEKVANVPDAPPNGGRLRAKVLQKIDGPLQKILTPIIEAYPDAMTHAAVAERAGYSHQSGTWSTYLSRLRSLDLIDGRGALKAQDWLFP